MISLEYVSEVTPSMLARFKQVALGHLKSGEVLCDRIVYDMLVKLNISGDKFYIQTVFLDDETKFIIYELLKDDE